VVFFEGSSELIPLTGQVRRGKGRKPSLEKRAVEARFSELISIIRLSYADSANNDIPSISFIHESESWWDASHSKFSHVKPESRAKILRDQTFWFRRLKTNIQMIIMKKFINTKHECLALKEILHTADALVTTILIGFPEVIDLKEPYKFFDNLISNVISNCVFSYADYILRLKRLRKYIKKCVFEKRDIVIDASFRKFGFLVPCVKILNGLREANSKSKMFRLSLLTQTRACGLADTKICKKSIDEFVATVTAVTPFEPLPNLLDKVEKIWDMAFLSFNKSNPNFRMSCATSGCWENGRSKEGKFGYLRQLIGDGMIEPPPLELKYDDSDPPEPSFADSVFYLSKEMVRQSPDTKRVRVAAIRENGKARTVTAGSAFKDFYLQPYQHLFMEIIRNIPSLRDGLSAGRLGYIFYNRLDPDNTDGAVLSHRFVKMFNLDFKTATDFPSHKAARCLMAPGLSRLGISQEEIDAILNIWAGPRDLYIGGKTSDKKVGTVVNGMMMGDPLTKIALSLVHPVCIAYATELVPDVQVVYDGNGDDGVGILGSNISEENIIEWTSHFRAAATCLGFQLSEDDTFVTNDWGTYCEEIFAVPPTTQYGSRKAAKLKDNRYSTYLDIVKLRLIIDTKKDRSDFSSVTEGKVTQFGKDLNYVMRDGRVREKNLFSIADICQDLCLNLRRARYPVYLPREIYGIGKVPMNWSIKSWKSKIDSQSLNVRKITYETIKEVLGDVRPNLINRNGIIKFDLHYENETYTAIREIPRDHPVNMYKLCNSEEIDVFPLGLIEKLVKFRRLSTETDVARKLLLHNHLQTLAGAGLDEKDLFEDIKIYATTMVEPSHEEKIELLQRFKDRYMDRPWSLKNLKKQGVYLPVVMEILHKFDPLRITTPPAFVSVLQRDIAKKPEESKGRHERHVDALESWFISNYRNLINNPKMSLDTMPRDILDDDPIIIRECALLPDDQYIVLLVSDDRALANQIELRTSKVVHRVAIKDWMLNECDEDKFFVAFKNFDDIERNNIYVCVDQGSMEAYYLKIDYTRVDRRVPAISFAGDIDYSGLRENRKYIILPNDNMVPIDSNFLVRFSHTSRDGENRKSAYKRTIASRKILRQLHADV